jgi:hypothetical protein
MNAADLQGRDETLIAASPERIWSLLTESARPGQAVALGARCRTVRLGSKRGPAVERRTNMRIEFEVDGRMLADYAFAIELAPHDGGTIAALESYYRPRGPLVRALNRVVLRRRLHRIRVELLDDLRHAVESEPAVTHL